VAKSRALMVILVLTSDTANSPCYACD
jgi:hypothetical protein